jgi:hypothetical protein
MRQLASLAWKEWNESRWLLIVALAVFLGLPAIGGLEAVREGHRFAILVSPWVFYLGGVLAVFVGVDAACRDLRGRLEDFWRSRPVGTAKWLLVKYFLGLAVVLVACIVPLVAEIKLSHDHYAIPYPAEVMLAWCPFQWAALYSMGFLAGCVLRRGAHAAMLALAGMLLVYFLPVVVPPIERMSIGWVLETSAKVLDERNSPAVHRVPWIISRVLYTKEQLVFVAGMLALSAASVGLALKAVRRGWHVDSGTKLMYGSVGTALLILFASASFQLATNMPVLQSVELGAGENVAAMCSDGHRGIVFTGHVEMGRVRYSGIYSDSVRTMVLTASGIEMGPPAQVKGPNVFSEPVAIAWLPEHPDVAYYTRTMWEVRRMPRKAHSELVTVSADPAAPAAAPLRLWEVDDKPGFMRQFAWRDRMYIAGMHPDETGGFPEMATIDISEPRRPKIIASKAQSYYAGGFYSSETGTVELPPIPDLPPRQRLRAAIELTPRLPSVCTDGEVVCDLVGSTFITYRLRVMGSRIAEFEKAGQYDASLLERMFDTERGQCTVGGGFAYVSTFNSTINTPRVTVFDIRDPQHPRPVGHFAAPCDGPLVVCALPDGRALIGGRKLYLVGPPPRIN